MSTRVSSPQTGSVNILVMVVLLIIMGLAGSAVMLTSVQMRASAETKNQTRAFYLADSGSHIGVHMLRLDKDGNEDASVTETLADGEVDIDIEPDSEPDVYRILSTGRFDGIESTVETFVRVETKSVYLGGGFEMVYSTRPIPEVPIELASDSLVSGLDHDIDGNLLADQENAIPALAMQELPGDLDFTYTGNKDGDLEGLPTKTTNDVELGARNRLSANLERYARANADVYIDKLSGETKLEDNKGGKFGTQDNPVLVHIKSKNVLLDSNFEGYGTIVMETKGAGDISDTVFEMNSNARWHGLVYVVVMDDITLDNEALIKLDSNARIYGGMVLRTRPDNSPKTQFKDGADFLEMDSNARILFSHDTVRDAPGVQSSSGSDTFEIISYRVLK